MPTVASGHVSVSLTNYAKGYANQEFAAERLLPGLGVKKQADRFWIFDAARRAAAVSNDLRAPGSEANQVDFALTYDTFYCEGHALRRLVSDEEVENADAPIAPYRDAVDFLSEKLLLAQDIDLKTKLDAAGIGASDPTNEWDDATNGDPMADMKLAIETIEDAIGKRPNVMLLDSKVMWALKNHPDIVDLVKYTGTNNAPGQASVAGLQALFGLEEIIEVSCMKNAAVLNQTASMSRVWGSDVYVAYRTPRPAIKTMSLGYRFVWDGLGPVKGFKVETYHEQGKHSDFVELSKYYDQKICTPGACYRLQNRLT